MTLKTTNVAARFKAMLPKTNLVIGLVTFVNPNGTSKLTLVGGTIQIVARGTSVPAGSNAFVKDGVVQGLAPSLTSANTTIY